jgi:dipeptidyl aminopeptidase/acylaminoacyl peptidase
VAIRPFGTWPSTLDADLVARTSSPRFGTVDVRAGRVRWTESRAAEGGRAAIVERDPQGVVDVTPSGANARTRVHEYGGGAVWYHGDTTFYCEFADSRVYRVDGAGTEPRPITPEPAEPHALRYADGVVTPDGETVICVRERHEGGEVWNEFVSLPADGSAEPHVLVDGHDFFMAPRLDPAGRRLAWLAWDHPRMPWDGTELWVADLDALGNARLVAGGPDESVIDPQWSPDGVLHFCSDRTGWWNLYRADWTPLTSLDGAELGFPAWVFGMCSYAFLDDGRIACVVTREAVESLELLDPASRELESAGLDWTSYSRTAFCAGDGLVVFAAASPTEASQLVSFDPATGSSETLRNPLDFALDAASISVPRAIAFPTSDGATAHAFYYPPANAEWEGPAGEAPPLRVICHGGPTAHSEPQLDLETQFFTQRGIGVVDVNYRGSTGFGREYRRLLNGRWGEIDWQDCVAAARYLAAEGDADPDRTWVEGGSAGGYVVFCALVFDPTAFAAGVSYFGVADAEALALHTHKFESRYLDSMIGPYPEERDLYRARSPVHFADQLERPMLLLQGLDDKVVLPSQAEAMVAVLESKGIPHAYIAFEGEGHGFRQQANVRRSLEATLSFVGQVFGFAPADELDPLELTSAR